MLHTRETVAAAALALTPEDRELLVDELLRSLGHHPDDDDIDPAWLDEAERRLAAYDRGEGITHDGQKVIEALERGEMP